MRGKQAAVRCGILPADIDALFAKEVGEDVGQMLPDGVDGGWVASAAVNDV